MAAGGGGNAQEVVGEEGGEDAARREVRWTDACGRELVEIREFEVRYVFDVLGVLFVKVCCFGNF